MRDPVEEFRRHNRDDARRSPELIRFKIARMAAAPLGFFRGTFHLFARDLLDRVCEPVPLLSDEGVEMDLVGDAHSENYGTYKAADGAVHYDINDFDETTHGHFDFDLRRLATSLFLAARDRGDSLADATTVALTCLTTYTETVHRLLRRGKDPDFDVSAASPSGCQPVDDLILQAEAAKRMPFLQKLTQLVGGQRRLVRSMNYYNLPDSEREQARRLLADYAARMPEMPRKDYFEMVDVCGRVSGIGSMGRRRYAVLIVGKGGPEARHVLLEFKEARPSAYDLYRQRANDAAALLARAERVITVQRASQAASSIFLGHAVDGPLSFQVRVIGPQDARVDVKTLRTPSALPSLARVQASILARIHARAVMRAVGLPRLLAQLGDADAFCQRVLSFVLAYADVVQRDWVRFVGQRADLEQCERWA
jgi:uncharacterized protein (DUF2252 family)